MIKRLSSCKAVLIALNALPGLAQATAEGAASNLVLGGQIKLGLEASQVSGSGRPGADPMSCFQMANNTSYFFLAGRERLNDRLSTVFHLEWDYAANNGVPGRGRAFYLGFDHSGLGRLLLGRQSVFFSHHWFVNDPHGAFDAAPRAANSLNVLGTVNGAHFAGSFLNNTVRYEAPDIRGFSGIATYSFDGAHGDSGRSHTWYVGPTYTRGPFKLGYFHMVRTSQGRPPAQIAGNLDQTADRFAVGYKWEGWQIGAVVDRNRVIDRASGVSQDRYAYAVPVNYGWGRHLVSLTYGQALPMRLDGRTLDHTGARMLSLSYQYKLSRRTTLDATLVALRNARNGRYNFWLGSPNGSPQLAPADAGARAGMVYLGIKHLF
ncbi:MAG: porin [Achromobacter sp.]|uniref:porin n=1 Tax=Achromobacter sp. TaxID=134375 RepID=UPI003D02401D